MINIKKAVLSLFQQPAIKAVLEQELQEALYELNKSEAAREEWEHATRMYKDRIERLTKKLMALKGEDRG